jgi:hypothetical protein
MNLSKGEYTQFSLGGKLNLLKEYGLLLSENKIDEVNVKIYFIYDFYVEVFSKNNYVTKAEPIVSLALMKYYL